MKKVPAPYVDRHCLGKTIVQTPPALDAPFCQLYKHVCADAHVLLELVQVRVSNCARPWSNQFSPSKSVLEGDIVSKVDAFPECQPSGSDTPTPTP